MCPPALHGSIGLLVTGIVIAALSRLKSSRAWFGAEQLVSATLTEKVRNRPFAVTGIGWTVWNSTLPAPGFPLLTGPLV